MSRMSRVELFAAIRRDSRGGLSGRMIAAKYHVSRHTVQAALLSALPPPRKPLPPRASKLDPFKPVIDGMLRADLDAPCKQRHTAKRIYHRLIDEQHMRGVSYQIVRTYVAARKPKIRAEAGPRPRLGVRAADASAGC
jgi:transposase